MVSQRICTCTSNGITSWSSATVSHKNTGLGSMLGSRAHISSRQAQGRALSWRLAKV